MSFDESEQLEYVMFVAKVLLVLVQNIEQVPSVDKLGKNVLDHQRASY